MIVMTKITKGIWKTRKGDPTKYRYGAIVDNTEHFLFVDLGDIGDEEEFEAFLSDFDINEDFIIEVVLSEHFDVEDVDFEKYTYKHKGSMTPFSKEN